MNLAQTLGASESQAQIAVLKEAINGIVLSDLASFNRAIGELGVVLMVGGFDFSDKSMMDRRRCPKLKGPSL